jgi:hypothetical protein
VRAHRFDGPTRGTHVFLGRGVIAPQSLALRKAPVADPSISVWCSLELTPSCDNRRRKPKANLNRSRIHPFSEDEILPPSAVRPVDF